VSGRVRLCRFDNDEHLRPALYDEHNGGHDYDDRARHDRTFHDDHDAVRPGFRVHGAESGHGRRLLSTDV
jgi:hypothetical protein